MPRILVTGASGFVGAHIALGLANKGHDVTAVGGQNSCPPEVANAVSRSINIDLASRYLTKELLIREQPHVIIHAAAFARPNECEKEPELAEKNTVATTRNIVRASNELLNSEPLIIYISTDLVHDGSKAPEGGFTESDPPTPKSHYGISKRQAELVVLAEAKKRLIARTCLVYGRKIENLTGFMGWLHGSLEHGQCIALFEDEWRTPIYVRDIVDGLDSILANRNSAPNPMSYQQGSEESRAVLNFSGAQRLSRYDFGMKVAQVFGFDPKLIERIRQEDFKSPASRPHDVSLSNKRLVTCFKVKPSRVREGLVSLKKELSNTPSRSI